MVCLFTDLRGLDDGEVVHTGCARAHGCSQTCCTKLHPGGQAFLQILNRSVSHQVLHHRCRLGVLRGNTYQVACNALLSTGDHVHKDSMISDVILN